jgi:hypothetical protein
MEDLASRLRSLILVVVRKGYPVLALRAILVIKNEAKIMQTCQAVRAITILVRQWVGGQMDAKIVAQAVVENGQGQTQHPLHLRIFQVGLPANLYLCIVL